MWDELFNSFKTGLNNGLQNMDWSKTLATAGGLWGMYNQSKMGKDMLKHQKDAFNYNKMLSQRQIDKENNAQNDLYSAWNKSTYGA